jgi:hypothetical protein
LLDLVTMPVLPLLPLVLLTLLAQKLASFTAWSANRVQGKKAGQRS